MSKLSDSKPCPGDAHRERPFMLVRLEWLVENTGRHLPNIRSFYATAYREAVGPHDLFSAFVVMRDVPASGEIQDARVFALVPEMDNRVLAKSTLIVTAGLLAIVRGVPVELGLDSPTRPLQ
jgi:hypothetical protein